MKISKSTITVLGALLTVTVSNLEKITQNMSDKEKSKVYDVFTRNIMDTLAVDTSNNSIFDCECSRYITPQEIMKKARWK